MDPGSVVEARAGTDSDAGSAAGATGTEAVTETATAVVVTADAGGTSGCGQTELRTGEVNAKVTGRSEKNIFRKLGVNNAHEATKYAMKAGIVDLVEYYI